jgi:hypothetical protein
VHVGAEPVGCDREAGGRAETRGDAREESDERGSGAALEKPQQGRIDSTVHLIIRGGDVAARAVRIVDEWLIRYGRLRVRGW